jgi:hypothetical protein
MKQIILCEIMHSAFLHPLPVIVTLHLFTTGYFIMFFGITNIYNTKIKGLTLMESFTATGKLEIFFDN